jgi:NNP family nitrate/nitrite transporter-like MFS transporter
MTGRADSNGLMSGLVGAMGNLGGIVCAIVFRFVAAPLGKAFWITGIIACVRLLHFSFLRAPPLTRCAIF